jgi:tRNA(Arg) A34 adenosine deaminase TadA
MYQQAETVAFRLPAWVNAYCAQYRATDEPRQRMQFVIEAARLNVARRTGGPFAAAVFQRETHELVSLGVNLVVTEGMSMLHAEMVAIALAQQRVGTYDLGGVGMAAHELVVSAEPCAMCFGAIPWSGIRKVVTGALDADVRDIGFEEGPKPVDWIGQLRCRGIEVEDGVERAAAVEVLVQYRRSRGHIYNSREN